MFLVSLQVLNPPDNFEPVHSIYLLPLKSNNFENYPISRYTYIVHPLAYRPNTQDYPDCSVDAIQWSILNLHEEGNLKKSAMNEISAQIAQKELESQITSKLSGLDISEKKEPHFSVQGSQDQPGFQEPQEFPGSQGSSGVGSMEVSKKSSFDHGYRYISQTA